MPRCPLQRRRVQLDRNDAAPIGEQSLDDGPADTATSTGDDIGPVHLTIDLLHTRLRRAVRAMAPSRCALGFGVRTNVVRSTATRPNWGAYPRTHSKLSMKLQWKYPRTSIPSATAEWR